MPLQAGQQQQSLVSNKSSSIRTSVSSGTLSVKTFREWSVEISIAVCLVKSARVRADSYDFKPHTASKERLHFCAKGGSGVSSVFNYCLWFMVDRFTLRIRSTNNDRSSDRCESDRRFQDSVIYVTGRNAAFRTSELFHRPYK